MTERPRYLVVGSDGTIGSALLNHVVDQQAIGTTRRFPASDRQLHLDLNSDLANWSIPEGVQVVINCAAVARLEACKRDPIGSRQVNVDSVITLAEKCRQAGIFFIQLSTDKVFSGQTACMPANAPFDPITEYGQQKADAERHLLKLQSEGASLAIIRLTKVLTHNMPLFRNWYEALKRSEVIRPFADMTLAPVPLPVVLDVIAQVAAKGDKGIFQISGDRDISYAEAAYQIAEQIPVSSELVQPVNAQENGSFGEHISPFTTLNVQRIQDELHIYPPAVLDAVSWSLDLPVFS